MKKIILLVCGFLVVTSSFAQSPFVDSLERIVALQKHDSVEMLVLLELTYEFSRKDFKKSLSYARQVLNVAHMRRNNTRVANAYSYMTMIQQDAGRPDSAQYFLNLLQSLSKNNPNVSKISNSYNQAAGLFYKNQGQYLKALPFMQDNLKLLKEEDQARAGQLLNIGNLYSNIGDFKSGVAYHLKALALFEKLNGKHGQAFCLQSIGYDFYRLQQYVKAGDYYQRAFRLKEELKDRRGMITAWSGLGDVSTALKEYQNAEGFYLEALKISQEIKWLPEESKTLNKMGILYKHMGDLPRARMQMIKALGIARQLADSTLTATIGSELAGVTLAEKKERDIESTLLSNLNTFERSGDKSSEAASYAQLSEYYTSQKQFEKALMNLQRYHQLRDSLTGNGVLLQMKELEEEYQRDKNEKTIALLKKDQELQTLALRNERTNVVLIAIALISVLVIGGLLINRYRVVNRARRIVEMERMRNTISRDLHDDIGSMLSSINIISQIAINENNGNAKHHLQRIGEHSSRMMESMNDIVWSINPDNDSLKQVVVKMKEFAAEILEPKNINYVFEGEESLNGASLDVHIRKNIFLIFKETINNAAKYSEANHITINMEMKNNGLHLYISDDGKGFDFESIKPGNGLRNIRERVKSVNGKIDITTGVKKGTIVSVDIPIG